MPQVSGVWTKIGYIYRTRRLRESCILHRMRFVNWKQGGGVAKKRAAQQKAFVLDTNVFIHDPEAVQKFPRHLLVIPLTVLEELDGLKKAPNEIGKNARQAIRSISELCSVSKGTLDQGVVLPNASTLKIETEMKTDFSKILDASLNDNKILLTALKLVDDGYKVVFVSKDFAVRLKAEALGLESQDYENYKASYDTLVKGSRTITVDKMVIDSFIKDGRVVIDDFEALPNEYVHLTDEKQSLALARYDTAKKCFVKLVQAISLWGIKPRNNEQKCAIDALLRDDVKLVMLLGPAGTGKTLMALAAGMYKVFDEGVYRKILVSRPIVPLGRDIGYLPGTKEEKLTHWMQPIFDNLEILTSSQGDGAEDTQEWVLANKKIEMEAVTYIRGRSLPKMYIIIDEAQNLTPHEIKTIISRAGEGTKVVLAGDPTQIDNPYLDKDSNGLTYAFAKLNDQKMTASIFLDKTERSELAAIAADLL
jgi:PhoH-like ATPase